MLPATDVSSPHHPPKGGSQPDSTEEDPQDNPHVPVEGDSHPFVVCDHPLVEVTSHSATGSPHPLEAGASTASAARSRGATDSEVLALDGLEAGASIPSATTSRDDIDPEALARDGLDNAPPTTHAVDDLRLNFFSRGLIFREACRLRKKRALYLLT